MEHFTFTDASKGSIQIGGDNKRVSVAGDCVFGNVFGNNTLLMNASIIYNYTFKVEALSDSICLGIINENSINKINGYQPFSYNGYGLALRDDGNLYSPQGNAENRNDPYYLKKVVNGQFKAGDIIKMTLDTVNKQLIFNINGDNNNNITLDIINNDTNYRMAVYLYGSEEFEDRQSSITLNSYSINIHQSQKQEQDQKINDDEKQDKNEKLENVIRNFTRMLENKDQQIQQLQKTNHRQQEIILRLQDEHQKLQKSTDDLKEGVHSGLGQGQEEETKNNQTYHEPARQNELMHSSLPPPNMYYQELMSTQSQPSNNNNGNNVEVDVDVYGYSSLYSPYSIPNDNNNNNNNYNNNNDDNKKNEENKQQKEELENTNDYKE